MADSLSINIKELQQKKTNSIPLSALEQAVLSAYEADADAISELSQPGNEEAEIDVPAELSGESGPESPISQVPGQEQVSANNTGESGTVVNIRQEGVTKTKKARSLGFFTNTFASLFKSGKIKFDINGTVFEGYKKGQVKGGSIPIAPGLSVDMTPVTLKGAKEAIQGDVAYMTTNSREPKLVFFDKKNSLLIEIPIFIDNKGEVRLYQSHMENVDASIMGKTGIKVGRAMMLEASNLSIKEDRVVFNDAYLVGDKDEMPNVDSSLKIKLNEAQIAPEGLLLEDDENNGFVASTMTLAQEEHLLNKVKETSVLAGEKQPGEGLFIDISTQEEKNKAAGLMAGITNTRELNEVLENNVFKTAYQKVKNYITDYELTSDEDLKKKRDEYLENKAKEELGDTLNDPNLSDDDKNKLIKEKKESLITDLLHGLGKTDEDIEKGIAAAAEDKKKEGNKDDIDDGDVSVEDIMPSISDARNAYLLKFLLMYYLTGQEVYPTEDEAVAMGLDPETVTSHEAFNTEAFKIYILYPAIYGFIDFGLENNLKIFKNLKPDVSTTMTDEDFKHKVKEEYNRQNDIAEKEDEEDQQANKELPNADELKSRKKKFKKEAIKKALLGVHGKVDAGVGVKGDITGNISLGIAASAGVLIKATGDVKADLGIEGRGGDDNNELASLKGKANLNMGTLPRFALENPKVEGELEGDMALTGALSSTGQLHSEIFGWTKKLWDVVIGRWDLLNLKFGGKLSLNPFKPFQSFELGELGLTAEAFHRRIATLRSEDYGIDFSVVDPEFAYMITTGKDIDKATAKLDKDFTGLGLSGDMDVDGISPETLMSMDDEKLSNLRDEYILKYRDYSDMDPVSERIYKRLLSGDDYVSEIEKTKANLLKHNQRIESLVEMKQSYDTLKSKKDKTLSDADLVASNEGFANSLDARAFLLSADTAWYEMDSELESTSKKDIKKEARENIISKVATKDEIIAYEKLRLSELTKKHRIRTDYLVKYMSDHNIAPDKVSSEFVDYYMRLDSGSTEDMPVLSSASRDSESKLDKLKAFFSRQKSIESVLSIYATKENLIKYEKEEIEKEQKKLLEKNKDKKPETKVSKDTDAQNDGQNNAQNNANKKKDSIDLFIKSQGGEDLDLNSYNENVYKAYIKKYWKDDDIEFIRGSVLAGFISVKDILDYEMGLLTQNKDVAREMEIYNRLNEIANIISGLDPATDSQEIKNYNKEALRIFGGYEGQDKSKYHINVDKMLKDGKLPYTANDILSYEQDRLDKLFIKKTGKDYFDGTKEKDGEYAKKLITALDGYFSPRLGMRNNAKMIVNQNISVDSILEYEMTKAAVYQSLNDSKKYDKHRARVGWLQKQIAIIRYIKDPKKRDAAIDNIKKKYFDGTVDVNARVGYLDALEYTGDINDVEGFLTDITNVKKAENMSLIAKERAVLEALEAVVRLSVGKEHVDMIKLIKDMMNKGKSDSEILEVYIKGSNKEDIKEGNKEDKKDNTDKDSDDKKEKGSKDGADAIIKKTKSGFLKHWKEDVSSKFKKEDLTVDQMLAMCRASIEEKSKIKEDMGSKIKAGLKSGLDKGRNVLSKKIKSKIPIVGGVISKKIQADTKQTTKKSTVGDRFNRIRMLSEFVNKLESSDQVTSTQEYTQKIWDYYTDILGAGGDFLEKMKGSVSEFATPFFIKNLEEARNPNSAPAANKEEPVNAEIKKSRERIEYLESLDTDDKGRVGENYTDYLIKKSGLMGKISGFLHNFRGYEERRLDAKRLLRPVDILDYEKDRLEEIGEKHQKRIDRLSKEDVTPDNALKIYREMGGGNGFEKAHKGEINPEFKANYKAEIANIRRTKYNYDNIMKFEKDRSKSYSDKLQNLYAKKDEFESRRKEFQKKADEANKKANIISRIILKKRSLPKRTA